MLSARKLYVACLSIGCALLFACVFVNHFSQKWHPQEMEGSWTSVEEPFENMEWSYSENYDCWLISGSGYMIRFEKPLMGNYFLSYTQCVGPLYFFESENVENGIRFSRPQTESFIGYQLENDTLVLSTAFDGRPMKKHKYQRTDQKSS